MAASYPSAAKSFTTHSAAQTIASADINAIQDELVAVENGLISGLAHDLKFTDASFDIGKTGATRPRDLFLSRTLGLEGGQIVFPAAQLASSNVNTLDDYEEGSWTPTIGGSGGQSGQVYSSQVGRYIKIGKLVWVTFSVTLSTLGTITTNVQIQGLPFTSDNVTSLTPVGAILWSTTTTSFVNMIGQINANATTATVFGLTAAATSFTALAQANLAATTTLNGTFVYQAAA